MRCSVPNARARTRVLAVRCRDHDLAHLLESSGELVQPDRVNAIVVGHQNAHACFLARRNQRSWLGDFARRAESAG